MIVGFKDLPYTPAEPEAVLLRMKDGRTLTCFWCYGMATVGDEGQVYVHTWGAMPHETRTLARDIAEVVVVGLPKNTEVLLELPDLASCPATDFPLDRKFVDPFEP